MGEWREPQFRDRAAAWGMDALARLKPGVTTGRGRTGYAAGESRLGGGLPDVDSGIKTTIVPLKEQIVGDVRPVLVGADGRGTVRAADRVRECR